MRLRIAGAWLGAALVAASAGGCKRRETTAPTEEVVRAYDGPQPELVIQVGPNHFVSDAKFSPDGRWLAVSSVDGLLKVFDVRTGKLWRTYHGASGPLYTVVWSPDGRMLSAAGVDRTVHSWEFATGVEVAAMTGHVGWIGNLEYSPDGRHIASACRVMDKVVAIWDVEKKGVRHSLLHEKDVKDLAWSRDGKWLLTAGDEVMVWSAESGGMLGSIAIAPKGEGRKPLRFSPDGKLLAIDAEDGVHLYDPGTWGEVGKIAGSLVGWAPDSSLLVFRGGEVMRVNARSGQRLAGFSAAGNEILVRGQLAPDGQLVATIDEMQVHLFDGATGAKVRTIESTFWKQVGGAFGNATDLLQVAWSPTAPVIATAGYDGVLRVLDLSRGAAPKSVVVGPRIEKKEGDDGKNFLGWSYAKVGLVYDIEFTRDGRYVLSRDAEGLSLWEPSTMMLVRRFDVPHATAQSISPDGKLLAVAHKDAVISVFDLFTGARLRDSKGGGLDADCQQGNKSMVLGVGVGIDGVEWSADASKLYAVYGSTSTFVELDAKTFEIGKGGCAHRDMINTVAYSRARDKVAIGAGIHYTAQLMGELVNSDNSINVFSLSGDMPRLHRFPGHKLAVLGADFSPDGNLLATGSADRTVRLWDLRAEAEVARFEGHGAEVDSLAFSHDGKYLASASYDLTVKVWDLATKAEVATIVMLGPDGHVIMTPDNYYTASRTGFESVSFRLGEAIVPVELYDLRLNRPDIVLSRFGYAPPDLVGLYEKAYRKRLKKMRIAEEALRPEYHLPTTKIASEVPISTRERKLPLRVIADDERYRLDRLHVYVNDVPIHGSTGLDLRTDKTKHHERELDIELLPGRNKIQVAVLNETGTESLKDTVEVVSTAPPVRPDLYVVAVGVSRYADVKMNLKYAAKDAEDISRLFKNRGSRFGKIEVLQILDGEARRENILAAREKLSQTKIGDQVIVFVAGHGMLDDNLDYYFVTHDFDRDKPAKRGLSYEQLESLLDGIPARRKLMMMDTCHSGEVDEDAVRVPPPPPGGGDNRGTEDVKVASDFRTFSYSGAVKSPDRSHDVLAQMFADLRRGSGAAVISSASGAEFALESPQWKNGVFTYSVLQGLMSGHADGDRDGTISVSELRDYVVHEVHRLTRGAQTPTARRENLEFDFPVL